MRAEINVYGRLYTVAESGYSGRTDGAIVEGIGVDINLQPYTLSVFDSAVTVRVLFYDRSVVTSVIGGMDLTGCPVSIFSDNGECIVSGTVSVVSIDGVDSPIALTVEATEIDRGVNMCRDSVDTDLYPNAADPDSPLTVVFGQPFNSPLYFLDTWVGQYTFIYSVAVWGYNDSVVIFDHDTGDRYPATVEQTTDGNGVGLLIIDGSALSLNTSNSYSVYGAGRPFSVTDLLLLLVSSGSVKIDPVSLANVRGYTDGLNICIVLTEGVNMWAWFVEHLLPVLPLSITGGANGLSMHWRGPNLRLNRTLYVDGWGRVSPFVSEGSRMNTVTLRYGYNQNADVFTGSVTVGTGSVGIEYETIAVADSHTAKYVCEWLYHRHLTNYTVTYDTQETDINPGEAYRVIDTRLGFDRICYVSRISYRVGYISVSFTTMVRTA
jgi:hypothetical protein